jgi:hypothetical protein
LSFPALVRAVSTFQAAASMRPTRAGQSHEGAAWSSARWRVWANSEVTNPASKYRGQAA